MSSPPIDTRDPAQGRDGGRDRSGRTLYDFPGSTLGRTRPRTGRPRRPGGPPYSPVSAGGTKWVILRPGSPRSPVRPSSGPQTRPVCGVDTGREGPTGSSERPLESVSSVDHRTQVRGRDDRRSAHRPCGALGVKGVDGAIGSLTRPRHPSTREVCASRPRRE